MGDTARLWEGLLQKAIEANCDIVGGKRLKSNLDRLGDKYPALKNITIGEGSITLPEDFPEDESGIMTVCAILGALYWTLDMFTGSETAIQRIRRPARKYLEASLPSGTKLGLNRYLPKLDLDGEKETPAGLEEEGEKTPSTAGKDRTLPEPKTSWDTGDGPSEKDGEWKGEKHADAEDAGPAPAPEVMDVPRFNGTVEWLGGTIPRGSSLLVEGPGEAKEQSCLRFLKDGLEKGENAMVLISDSPASFREKMKKTGRDTAEDESAGRLRILDWYTFRERTVEDLEDEGSVMVLPKELPFVGSAINLALGELAEGGSPRAFVNILPKALATVAIETVHNFIQVSILKFKKKNLTTLYTMETEKDPEKAAIRNAFHSSVRIEERDDDGGLFVRTNGPVLSPVLREVRFRDGQYTIEKEEISEEARAAPPPPAHLAQLRKKLGEWRATGYNVNSLEKALAGDPESAKSAFETYSRALDRAKSIKAEYKIMDLTGLETEAECLLDLFKDPDRLGELEDGWKRLLETAARKKDAARQAAAAKPPAGPPAAGPDEDAKRAEMRDILEKWKSDGYRVDMLEAVMDLEFETIRKEFVLFRIQLQRLKELEKEIGGIASPGVEETRSRLAKMFRDVSRVPELEKGLEELRREAEKMRWENAARRDVEQKRKTELAQKLEWYSSQGLATGKLEAALAGPPADAEKAFSDFDGPAKRLIRLREEFSALDISQCRDAASAVEHLLTDVAHLSEAETAIASLREECARVSREAGARAKLQEKLGLWRSRGFVVGRLDGMLDGDLASLTGEFSKFEEGVRASEEVQNSLGKMDVKGHEKEAGELRRMLTDVALVGEAREAVTRLRHDIERSRAEATERAQYTAELEVYKAAGIKTEVLEAALGQDILPLRRAALEFRFFANRYGELAAMAEPHLSGKYAAEASAVKEEFSDIAKISQAEEHLLALLSRIEAETLASGKELDGEFEREFAQLDKLGRWIDDGYHLRRLDSLLNADTVTLQFEIEKLDKDIEQLSKMSSALEVLDTKGLDRDLAYLRTMLNDPDKLPAVRALIDALRFEIGRRKKEEERTGTLRSMLQEWTARGYDTGRLGKALEGDLEAASREFVKFRAAFSAAEKLDHKLELLISLGYRDDCAGLRTELHRLDKLEEVKLKIDGLWKAAQSRNRENAASKDAGRERRHSLRTRILDWVDQGLVVRRPEKALAKSIEEAETEFKRFEEDFARLRSLGQKIQENNVPGFEAEIGSLRAMLNDPDRIGDIEKGIARIQEAVEADRRARDEQKIVEDNARKARQENEAQARSRCNQLRSEVQSFLDKGVEGVPGTEELLVFLSESQNLERAQRAFSEFRPRAEARLKEIQAERDEVRLRIDDFAGRGDDVSALERALDRGVPEARVALTEHEKHRKMRELEDTWKGIKSKLFTGDPQPEKAPPAEDRQKNDGKIVKKITKKKVKK